MESSTFVDVAVSVTFSLVTFLVITKTASSLLSEQHPKAANNVWFLSLSTAEVKGISNIFNDDTNDKLLELLSFATIA